MKDRRRINSLPAESTIRNLRYRHTFEFHRASQKKWHFPKIHYTKKVTDPLTHGFCLGRPALSPVPFLNRNKGETNSGSSIT